MKSVRVGVCRRVGVRASVSFGVSLGECRRFVLRTSEDQRLERSQVAQTKERIAELHPTAWGESGAMGGERNMDGEGHWTG